MKAPDLRLGPPRRWNAELDGVIWLPRLIDKTRAAWAGTLGGYLYGQSPMDREFLRALGIGYREFASIVRDAPDDRAVVTALEARDPGTMNRARSWSAAARSKFTNKVWYFALDLDDGYAGGPLLMLKRPINALTNGAMAVVKRVWPSRAIERAKHP